MASALARTLFAILLLCLSTLWAEVISAEEPLDNKTWIENAWKNFNPGGSVAEQTKAPSFVKTADYLLLNDHYAYIVGVIDGFFFGNAEAENGFPNVIEGCLDKLNPSRITPIAEQRRGRPV